MSTARGAVGRCRENRGASRCPLAPIGPMGTVTDAKLELSSSVARYSAVVDRQNVLSIESSYAYLGTYTTSLRRLFASALDT